MSNYAMPFKAQQLNAMNNQPLVVYPVDPYVVEVLKSCIGKCVSIKTTDGHIDGTVVDCKSDHVVLRCCNDIYFVRISEIVWIKPK
ncbi:DUF2642 domain-containing protein [Paenibacillus sp. FSL H8-0548]|uniref:DUF2642 domain-containing protein n=1 Tax=Paenibacillus sp. FSL H8-0548 TaxID=1920422 RepID=UPI0026ABA86C|nr:DUF2642 domain-containing protein [Paenibacillus sp. FSL H8-0548]